MKVINEQTKQEKADKPYTMIVKPTHDCNLNCAYCFDRPLRKKYGKLIMNMDTVKRMVENMNRDQRKCYCFTWHGGEPLMCGVEWYEKSMEYMYKNLDYIPPFTIQTNGTLLTEEYIAMLTSYKIYIGVSYDFESEELGIKSLRKNITEEHMGQINEWIKKYQGTPIGSITVVNAENYKYLKEIHQALDKKGLHCSYNPVYPTDDVYVDNKMFFTMEEFAKEFGKMVPYILRERPDFHERNILMSMSYLFGGTYSCCNRKDCSYGWVGIGPNGYISHCDTLSYGSLGFDTIFDYQAITDFQYTKNYENIVALRKKYRTEKCSKCVISDICPGTCFSNCLNNANNGLAINQNACDDLAYSMFAIYKSLRNIDIYQENRGSAIVRSILSNDFYTSLEIRTCVNDLYGIDIYMLDQKVIDSPSRLFDSKEFKIFRIINPAAVRNKLRVVTFNKRRSYDDETANNLRLIDTMTKGDIEIARRLSIIRSIKENESKILEILRK